MTQALSSADLARSLDDAGGLTLLRVTHLTGRQVVFALDWQGKDLTFTATITETLNATVPPRPRQRNERAHLHDRASYSDGYTERQVRQLGYPLYFAEEWLRREKTRLGSFIAVAREYGYSETTLSGAARQYGWPPEKPPRSAQERNAARQDRAQGLTLPQIAQKYGVSIGTAHNWTRPDPKETP